MTDPFHIGDIEVGSGGLFFILGPCSLENEEFAWRMARSVKEVCGRLGAPFLFKASFDKANRTSLSSFRGPGVEEGRSAVQRHQVGADVVVVVVLGVVAAL